MGWSYGVLPDGREVGYGVHAVCEHPGCAKHIDRGLAHLCGAMHGQDDDTGCGHYFCGEHLLVGAGVGNSICEPCYERWCRDNPEICCDCGYDTGSPQAIAYHNGTDVPA